VQLEEAIVGTPVGVYGLPESQEVGPPTGGERDVAGCGGQGEIPYRVSHPTSDDGSVFLRKQASSSGARSVFVKTAFGVEVALDRETLVHVDETTYMEGVEYAHVVAFEGPFCGTAGWCKMGYVHRDSE
jgi:hypothetical protein